MPTHRELTVQRLDELLPVVSPEKIFIADDSVPAEQGALSPGRGRFFLQSEGQRINRFARLGEVVEHCFEPEDILICPRNTWHRYLPSPEHQLFTAIFDRVGTFLYWRIGTAVQYKYTHLWRFTELHSRATRFALVALDSLSPDQVGAAANLVRSAICLIRDEIAGGSEEAPRSLRTFEFIKRYMADNCYLPINRRTVAEEFQIHPNHVSRLFKEHASESFLNYLTRLRLDRAQYLLRSTNCSIAEVAEMCGFSSANYFIKVFRKHVGQTPGSFA